MTRGDEIRNAYFDWMISIVSEGRYANGISYIRMLSHLHNTEFKWKILRDGNRADDGVVLRYRFAYSNPELKDAKKYLYGPCSVLEMMIALAIRCEETMSNTEFGDRTGQWFWGMIVNLGLGSMSDDRYDPRYVDDILDTFMSRKYDRNGHGGLFTVRNRDVDMRRIEIWYQLNYYLDEIM